MRESIGPADQLPQTSSIAQHGIHFAPSDLADLVQRFEVQRIVRGQREYAVDEKQREEEESLSQGSRDDPGVGEADLILSQLNKGNLTDVRLDHRQLSAADRRHRQESVFEIHVVLSGVAARRLELGRCDSFFLQQRPFEEDVVVIHLHASASLHARSCRAASMPAVPRSSAPSADRDRETRGRPCTTGRERSF